MMPPHMVTKRKAHIFSFQPMKRGHLKLFQKLHGRISLISKESGFFRSKEPKYNKAKSNVGTTDVEQDHLRSEQIDKNDL